MTEGFQKCYWSQVFSLLPTIFPQLFRSNSTIQTINSFFNVLDFDKSINLWIGQELQ